MLGKIQKVFRKIFNVLNRIKNALNGNGFNTFEDIFENKIKNPKTANYHALNSDRLVRTQKALENSRQNQANLSFETWSDKDTREDLERQIQKAMKDSKVDGLDQMSKMGEFLTFKNSMPGLASAHPLFAPVVNYFNRVESSLSKYLKHFNDALHDLNQDRQAYVNAAALLDHLRLTGQDFKIDKRDNRVTYTRDGKYYKAPENVSATALKLRETLKDVPRYMRQVLEGNLEELGIDIDNLDQHIKEQEAKLLQNKPDRDWETFSGAL